MSKTKEELEKITANLCRILTEEQLINTDLISVLANLLFSIGASLENCDYLTSEQVLIKYANNPTLGNVLMAQALHMKETWSQSERENKDGRSEQNV